MKKRFGGVTKQSGMELKAYMEYQIKMHIEMKHNFLDLVKEYMWIKAFQIVAKHGL